MSPNERDENEGLADAKLDAAEPADDTPAIEHDAPEVPADTPTTDVEEPVPAERKVGPTRASGVWAGLIIAAIVLIFLLVFILQNLETVEIDFLMFSGSLPIGVAMLLAAIGGILMVAIPGVARMIQLRRHTKR
jgi:uncharacterized integral membrane protein